MSTPSDPNFKNRKTPGAHRSELNAIPSPIVGVATAVPAFIGYTKCATRNGKSVLMQPVEIHSMADCVQVFGSQYNATYDLVVTSKLSGVTPVNVGGQMIVPIVAEQPRFNLYYSMQLFYANGGGSCYVVSVGDYSRAVAADALLQGLEAISRQAGPTLLVVPDAVLLPASGQNSSVPMSADFNSVVQAMLDQCARLQDRMAIFDLYGATAVTHANVDSTLKPCAAQFQQAVISPSPGYGAAYFPFLNTTIVDPKSINYTNFNPQQPAAETLSEPIKTQLQYVLTLLNRQQPPTPAREKVQALINQFRQDDPHDAPAVASTDEMLRNALPAYAQLLEAVASIEGVLPPSGAIAGMYVFNDQTQGVWNAPANLSLQSTASLTVNLNDEQQGSLNVPVNGKAIDVIRNFAGRGSVVWGARTLDGNSDDWRYVQVRRTVIYIEQSIRAGLKQFSFSPNIGATWSAVVQLISVFLVGLWSDGGLMGDKASDAFSVQCALGTTMTGEDILNGYMNVTVGVRIVHPAEFIVLTFQQKMQGTA